MMNPHKERYRYVRAPIEAKAFWKCWALVAAR
jgi:hypothetical protein